MKKIVSLLLTFTILVTMTIPVFADDTYSLDPCTSTCEVNAVIDSQYTMILPATINLKRMPNSGACYGNIIIGCVGHLTDGYHVRVYSDQNSLYLEGTNGDNIQLVNSGVENKTTGNIIQVLCGENNHGLFELIDDEITYKNMTKALDSKLGKEILTSDHRIDMDNESFDTSSDESIDLNTFEYGYGPGEVIVGTIDFVTNNDATEMNNNGLIEGKDYINMSKLEGFDTDGDLLLETANAMVENDEDYDYDTVDECLVKEFNFFSKPILCTVDKSGESYEGTLTFNFFI